MTSCVRFGGVPADRGRPTEAGICTYTQRGRTRAILRAAAGAHVNTYTVELGRRSYPILIGAGLIARAELFDGASAGARCAPGQQHDGCAACMPRRSRRAWQPRRVVEAILARRRISQDACERRAPHRCAGRQPLRPRLHGARAGRRSRRRYGRLRGGHLSARRRASCRCRRRYSRRWIPR